MKESLRLLFLGGEEAMDVPAVEQDVELARLMDSISRLCTENILMLDGHQPVIQECT